MAGTGALHWRHWPGDADRPGIALHCMMGRARAFDGVAAGLGGMLDLRAPDLPGHGDSPDWQPQPGVDFHTHVTRLVAQAIDRPLDLIGHSFGATVALRIAVGAPHAVRTLTLIEPPLYAAAPPAARAEDTAQSAALAQALAEGRIEQATEGFVTRWGAQGWDRLPPPARRAMMRQIRLVADSHGALSLDAHAILRPGGLEGIDAPVMIVTGAESPAVMPAIAEALAARLPDVGRATIPGAGHMLPVTHAAQTAALIAENLARG